MQSRKRDTTKKYLIANYARTHVGFEIPDALIVLMLSFCQDGLHWTFSGKDLKEFLISKNGEKLKSVPFFQNQIGFQCILCRNPTQGFNIGYLQFSLKIYEWPLFISTISVYYELKCVQTNSEWKHSVQFASKFESASWNNRMLSNDRLKQHDIKQLDFVCYVDIIHISYIDQNNKNDENYIFIDEECKHQWILNKTLLNNFIANYDNERQVFFSSNFNNDCFCMVIKSKTYWVSGKGGTKCKIGIKLLKLPGKLKKITTKITIKAIKNTNNTFTNQLFKKIDVVTFDMYSNTTFYVDAFVGIHNIIKTFNVLHSITVEIQILHIFDSEYMPIDHNKWTQYGINSMIIDKKQRSVISSLFKFK